MTTVIDKIVLTEDQQKAMDAFNLFLIDPIETVFVLGGYSGTGKSTLVQSMIERLPNFMRTARLVNPSQQEYEVVLTATTNKAAENLARITGMPVATIHSFLGLRVSTDYKTMVTTLVPKKRDDTREGFLLFIDEASFIDGPMLQWIFKIAKNCKIVFMGDPAQLTQVKATSTPVFNSKFTGAQLTQVVRQAAGNPILDLATKFRHTVNTGEFFSFKPDGKHVIHLSRAEFSKAIEAEFTRPGWKYMDSKILAWTNKCVIGYNHFVRNLVKGDPNFQVGDYAVCNSFLSIGKESLKTDQLVEITNISGDFEKHGVLGNNFTLDGSLITFMPKTLASRNARINAARKADDIHIVADIENTWVDLRGAAACTVNKAQGSTHDRVYIDLDDISRCNSGEQIARMLYVAVSRARDQVFLTGDLVS